jgi:hypothetical protein
MRRLLVVVAVGSLIAAFLATLPAGASGQSASSTSAAGRPAAQPAHWCNTDGVTCVEPFQNWQDFPFFSRIRQEGVKIGEYIGHDEPSALFYSSKPGAGNDVTYNLTLPSDPPVKPLQDGSGGTWNFQLRPTFWFGMAMCDDQSAPNPAYDGSPYAHTACTPDSDSNIFSSSDPSSPNYIGKAPGGGYMEMQFYPPGWVKWPVGNSCDAKRWCAALNIDSFSENQNTGVPNNTDCLSTAGLEPVNFAYLTKNGKATTPANPLNGARFNLNPSKDFFMASGDKLRLHMYDTPQGFTVRVDDMTAGTSGSMVASTANGFGSVRFDPSATSCSIVPNAFHPMYSTSGPDTRMTWTAHTYNIAMSDEIGHFEYCNKMNPNSPILGCSKGGGFDTNNTDKEDDNYCLPVPGAPGFESSRIQVTGCLGIFVEGDTDFDGVPYDNGTWPGSIADKAATQALTTTPVVFSSPTTGGSNYTQAAFENDLPRIEDFRPDSPFGGVQVNCQRHIANPADLNPGENCVNPPPQSRDYPFFVTTTMGGSCVWEEVGGLHLPNIVKNFGGSSKSEFGSLLDARYPTSPPGTVEQVYDTFHKTLGGNPCKA